MSSFKECYDEDESIFNATFGFPESGLFQAFFLIVAYKFLAGSSSSWS